METLFTILFFIVAVIISALMKRKQTSEESEDWSAPPSPPATGQSQPPRRANWEEELRRLLEGESAPPRPPPPVVRPAPPTTPALAPPRPAPQPERVYKPLHDWSKTSAKALAAAASDPYALRKRGEAPGAAITTAMRDVASRISRRGVKSSDSPEAPGHAAPHAALLFDSHASLRSAIVASVILGPPKSLEPRESSERSYF